MSSFLTPPLQSHSTEGLSVHQGLESSFGIHLNPLELSFSTFKVGLWAGPVSDTLLASTSGIPAQSETSRWFGLV